MNQAMVGNLFQLTLTAISAYKEARANFLATNPAATNLPDERQLFDTLIADSDQLKLHAQQVGAKYAEPGQTEPAQ